MTTKAWGHDELAHDLANHLRVNPEHMVWEDMQMGPSGSIRPDVYLLKKAYSTFAPVTYEVKVSVSDFRSDITSGKWQGYLKFSSAVIFAVPAGLINKADVPAGCGLIVRHDEVWRTVKRPTLQKIETLPHNSWMKMLIDGVERVQFERARLRQRTNSWAVEQKLRARFGDELARLIAEVVRDRESLEYHRQEIARKRQEIDEGHNGYVKSKREELERERRYADGAMLELGQALGLAEGFTAMDLTHAIWEAKRRIVGDGEVERLRGVIKNLHGQLERGMEPLPGEQAEPWQQTSRVG